MQRCTPRGSQVFAQTHDSYVGRVETEIFLWSRNHLDYSVGETLHPGRPAPYVCACACEESSSRGVRARVFAVFRQSFGGR